MNNRYFDHRMHAVSSARKLISALKAAGSDTADITADELCDTVIKGVIQLALAKQELDGDRKNEIREQLMNDINMRNRKLSEARFERCVNICAEGFKAGKRNDYQFFWNMIKEAMYCVEEASEERFGFKLDASTVSYHISNAAKEAVGAVGLEYSCGQMVF